MQYLLLFISAVLLLNNTSLAQTPTIASFTPESGPIGTSVTITGTNFDATMAENIVFFGATRATVNSASATQLTVTVPAGASYMPITVAVDGLVGYSQYPFQVTYDGSEIFEASFDTKENYSTGTRPTSIAMGDLDNDGLVDIVVTNKSDRTISVYLNTSTTENINFSDQVTFGTGSAPMAVAIGDLDRDGKSDLAVANQGDATVSVYRNTSSGTGNINFATRENFTVGSNPRSVVMGDIDLDGKTDLAVANYYSNSVSILKNSSTEIGTLAFDAKVDFSTGTQPIHLAIGDLNNDSKPDLAVANYSTVDLVSILRNTSSGSISFADKEDYIAGEYPRSVAIGDLDDDGRNDLVVANNNGHSVSVFLNEDTGNETIDFSSDTEYDIGSSNYGVALADLNGDNKIDIAAACISCDWIAVFENTISEEGTVSFGNRFDFETGEGPTGLVLGDFDNDGQNDIASANYWEGSISTFKNSIPKLSGQANFTSFEIDEQTTETELDSDNHTITLEVPFETDLTSIVATFTISREANAQVGDTDQISGSTANNYTIPLVYTITAEDGSTEEWTVTIEKGPNSEAKLISFEFEEQNMEATIDEENHTIQVEVAYGSNIYWLVPNFTLSEGATAELEGIEQISGSTYSDYSFERTLTIISEDGDTSLDWTISVVEGLNRSTAILEFTLNGQINSTEIDAENHTISLEVSGGFDLSQLSATFTLAYGAKAMIGDKEQISNETTNDFRQPLVYTIIAKNDDYSSDWTITVTPEFVLDIANNSQNQIKDLYPNPTFGSFVVPVNVEDNRSKLEISVLDLMGKKLVTIPSQTYAKGFYEIKIDLAPAAKDTYSAGLYLVEVHMTTIDNSSVVRKRIQLTK